MEFKQLFADFHAQSDLAKLCETMEGAFCKCDAISERFRYYLTEKGIDAKLISLYGDAYFENPHPEWARHIYKGQSMFHYVVLVGGVYVDWSYRQFEPTAEHPTTFTIEELREQWDDIEVEEVL